MRYLFGWIFKMALGAMLYALYVGDLKLPDSLKSEMESSALLKRITDIFSR